MFASETDNDYLWLFPASYFSPISSEVMPGIKPPLKLLNHNEWEKYTLHIFLLYAFLLMQLSWVFFQRIELCSYNRLEFITLSRKLIAASTVLPSFHFLFKASHNPIFIAPIFYLKMNITWF